MNEAELQETVIDLAHAYKWRVAHFRPARRADGAWRTPVSADAAGFPDLVLVRDRVLFVELKGSRGRMTLGQREWARLLIDAKAEWYCWGPAEWLGGVVQRTLR